MKTRSIICAFVAALLLTGCGETPHKVRTLELTPEEKVINTNQNGFTLDLLKQVSATETESENVFLSPLSVAIVGAMVANGAEGETLNQILRTIGAGDYSVDDLNAYYKNLLENLPYLDKYTDMNIANAIWVDDALTLKEPFRQTGKQYFKATIETSDLQDPAIVNTVNSWADKNTKGLIKEVVTERDFNEATRMVLANALYFKSKWQEKFNKTDTRKQDFTLSNGSTVQVDMMQQTKQLRVMPAWPMEHYYGPDVPDTTIAPYDARMLRMYFKDKVYCMDIILPREGLSCDDYLADLSMDKLAELEGLMDNYDVEVQMPKFKLDYRRDLEDDMKALGMTDVFDIVRADLTDLATYNGLKADADLFLDKLFQKTYFEVDEEGAKAAAVTIGIVADKAAPPMSIEPFIVDRPFLLFIREVKYGTILFAGKIGNPAE